MLFPSLDKRNTRDKADVLCITSERYIGELGIRLDRLGVEGGVKASLCGHDEFI